VQCYHSQTPPYPSPILRNGDYVWRSHRRIGEGNKSPLLSKEKARERFISSIDTVNALHNKNNVPPKAGRYTLFTLSSPERDRLEISLKAE
jgi:hypothetical protein